MARYYGAGYYSFKPRKSGGLYRRVVAARNRHAVIGGGLAGALLNKLQPTKLFDFLGPAKAALRIDSAVLDVGCGSGALVLLLREAGMRNALGIDPFADADLMHAGQPLVRRSTLDAMDGTFDLIMFHHSLEHMPDQLGTLRLAYQCLRPGGHCIVRVPLSSSEAWAHYGLDWVQLDAPRHFYLHSVDSMQRLVRDAGFSCEHVRFDSTAFQFWGSEQNRKGIALSGPKSNSVNPDASIFSAADIAAFDARARQLNTDKRGDQAGFVLRRA
ncbi:MAG: class I SAM-dependent methyltransferase [Rhodoferax sp.]|nr:class I SAM-dependent methyltransferase [Rhodoferax sp.]